MLIVLLRVTVFRLIHSVCVLILLIYRPNHFCFLLIYYLIVFVCNPNLFVFSLVVLFTLWFPCFNRIQFVCSLSPFVYCRILLANNPILCASSLILFLVYLQPDSVALRPDHICFHPDSVYLLYGSSCLWLSDLCSDCILFAVDIVYGFLVLFTVSICLLTAYSLFHLEWYVCLFVLILMSISGEI